MLFIINFKLRENLNLTQHQFNITMAVDVDSAKLWIVSEDVVAGPLNFGHISESKFLFCYLLLLTLQIGSCKMRFW